MQALYLLESCQSWFIVPVLKTGGPNKIQRFESFTLRTWAESLTTVLCKSIFPLWDSDM